MIITFLIGNGFDLNLGLDTRYGDFLKEYTEVSEKDSKAVTRFKSDILEEHELWANAELAFGKYTEKYGVEEASIDDFFECYEDFCSELAMYLFFQERRLNFRSLSNTIATQFADALSNILKGFRTQQKAKIIETIDSFRSSGFKYNFINFNYTRTLDECIGMIQKTGLLGYRTVGTSRYENTIKSSIHVHGTYIRDLILGVNDENQISNREMFEGYSEEYLNQLIKVRANEMAEENTDGKARAMLNESDLIYVYGMSLGATDALWWDRISIAMSRKPNLRIILHCHNVPSRELFSRKYLLFAKDVKEKFLSYSSLSENEKSKLAERIHVDDSNIFSELNDLVHSEKNESRVYADNCLLEKEKNAI